MRALHESEVLNVTGGNDFPPALNVFFEGASAVAMVTTGAHLTTAIGGGSLAAGGTMAVSSVPLMPLVAVGAMAFGTGMVIGDLVEQGTGWGSGLGNWAGTKLGEAGIWW
jgi:hypothetical protein